MNASWGKLAEDEAKALVKLLEGPTRRVLVLVMAHDGQTLSLLRSVSAGTTGADGRSFMAGLERERDRIAGKLAKRS